MGRTYETASKVNPRTGVEDLSEFKSGVVSTVLKR